MLHAENTMPEYNPNHPLDSVSRCRRVGFAMGACLLARRT